MFPKSERKQAKIMAGIRKNMTEGPTKMDDNKREKFENMKQDFSDHLSDRKAEIEAKLRENEKSIRRQHQSLLMQIPTSVQDMTMAELMAAGGAIIPDDGPIGFQIRIPRDSVNTKVRPMVITKDNPFKDPEPPKTVSRKKTSTKQTPLTVSRIITRSEAKKSVKKEVIATATATPTASALSPDVVMCALESTGKAKNNNNSAEDMETMTRSLSQIMVKPPREPKPDEPVIGPITIFCSTRGTPLILDQKTVERLSKTDP